MANKSRGYIRLWRCTEELPFWDKQGEAFDYAHAWIDLLLSVNYTDKDFVLRSNYVVHVKKGQMFTSYLSLSKKWHWSVKKVRRYLTLLQNHGLINLKPSKKGTLLTVINEGSAWVEGHTEDTTGDTTDDPTAGTRLNKGNKGKEEASPPDTPWGGEWQ